MSHDSFSSLDELNRQGSYTQEVDPSGSIKEIKMSETKQINYNRLQRIAMKRS